MGERSEARKKKRKDSLQYLTTLFTFYEYDSHSVYSVRDINQMNIPTQNLDHDWHIRYLQKRTSLRKHCPCVKKCICIRDIWIHIHILKDVI